MALLAGVAAAAITVVVGVSAATFSPDWGGSPADIPMGLWLLIGAAAGLTGITVSGLIVHAGTVSARQRAARRRERDGRE